MTDWFGEPLPETVEAPLPSHYENWYPWCQAEGCDEASIVYSYFSGRHLCGDHAGDEIS